jgi:hypothetical protein
MCLPYGFGISAKVSAMNVTQAVLVKSRDYEERQVQAQSPRWSGLHTQSTR